MTYGQTALVEVDPIHLEETRRGLGMFEPALRLELDREIKGALEEVASEAAGRLHPGPGDGAGKYKVSRRGAGFRITNADRGAMISEFAGRVNPDGKTPRGRTLIRTLNAAYGPPGRVAWAAWDAKAASVTGRIVAAVATAERALDARLGRS